jgi:hypothetical protein
MLAGPFATAAAQLKHAESGRPNARGAQCRLLADFVAKVGLQNGTQIFRAVGAAIE